MHEVQQRRALLVIGACVASFVLTSVPTVAGAAASSHSPKITDAGKIAALRADVRNGTLHETHATISPCHALNLHCRYSLVTTSRSSTTALSTAKPTGWGAHDLQRALRLTSAPRGKGMVTIIGIGAYPNLESDLNIYRSHYSIRPCTIRNKCLKIANYKGGPALQPSDPRDEEYLAVESALDVQMVSAACATCKITYLGVPVTLHSLGFLRGFARATETAVRGHTSSVSISYGFDTNARIDRWRVSEQMRQPGTALFSAAGDYGYMDPRTFQSATGGWPQNLRSVVSVGGTSMRAVRGVPTGYRQRMWDGAGSGCSPDLAPAYGQPAWIARACKGRRAVTDVAAVADNLAVYDSYAPYSGTPHGWLTVGGTSASSPFLAGMAARAPRVNDALGPNVIYRAPASAFADVTTGSNGAPSDCARDHVWRRLCRSVPGWDGGTGRGIPRGLAPFTSRPR